MPHYDYQCNACHTVFEVEHAMGAKPRIKCPACGSTRTSRQFSATGVHFTGSGFYVTDSRPGDQQLTGGKDITPKGDKQPDAAPAPAPDNAVPAKPDTASKPDTMPASKPAKTPEPAAG